MVKMQIINRFKELLAIKERRERRSISQREVSRELGLAKTTVDSYARNEITRFDADVVIALCNYLGCSVGDFLVIEEVNETPETESLQPVA